MGSQRRPGCSASRSLRERAVPGDQACSSGRSAVDEEGRPPQVPLSFRLDSIQGHPDIIMARRCTHKRDGVKVETQRVEL